MDLYNISIKTILENQSDTGAYIAAPDYPTYAYSWFRDSSFIAYSMDLVGQHHSAEAYHRWASGVIERYKKKIENLLQKRNNGEMISTEEFLHIRFTLDGKESSAEWMNFQLDGYGTWLWAFYEHINLTKNFALLNEIQNSIVLVLKYLIAFWKIPNFDCWEEFPEAIHPHTLAAIYGGLQSIKKLEKHFDKLPLEELSQTQDEIKEFILTNCIINGHIAKMVIPKSADDLSELSKADAVDASLLGIAIPYKLLPIDHPIMQATLSRIEADIHLDNGGVYRYLKDTYYGGGEWLLLTSWLGWYYLEKGDCAKAEKLLAWISTQADEKGFFPEQVSENILAPDYLSGWEQKWGLVAKPLLWSHAKYLILHEMLKKCHDHR